LTEDRQGSEGADSEGPLSLPWPWQYKRNSQGRARRPRRTARGWPIRHDSYLPNDPRTARDHCPYRGHGNTNGIPKVGPDVPGGPHGVGRSVTIRISPTIRGQRETTVPTLAMAIQTEFPKVGPDVPGGPQGVGRFVTVPLSQRSADSEGPLSLPWPWQYNGTSGGRARRPRRAAWGWSVRQGPHLPAIRGQRGTTVPTVAMAIQTEFPR